MLLEQPRRRGDLRQRGQQCGGSSGVQVLGEAHSTLPYLLKTQALACKDDAVASVFVIHH
ncbi:hypothetical protein THICB350039 [Thiomonas sp. CB3]|nr:hypothetical protein THICB350039 [Thiomonas sp. CB3]